MDFKNECLGKTIQNTNKNYKDISMCNDPDKIVVFKSNDKNKWSDGESMCRKTTVRIVEDFTDDESVMETTALRADRDAGGGKEGENYLTMNGTIQKGKNKEEKVEVILNMSREELDTIERNIIKKKKRFKCGRELGAGFHIFLWSVACFPISFVTSAIYSFCLGTLTWYGIFTLFSEGKSLIQKIMVPPLLIIAYPFLITVASIGLGLYAGVKQLSCCWNIWLEEFADFEKGFYGWLCNSLDMPECSPYEVVILSAKKHEFQ